MDGKTSAITVFEKMDEKQIERADKAVKEAMVYSTRIGGKEIKEITYTGIKHLILELSTHDNALEILESKCELEKDDPDDKSVWHWRAYKRFRNIKSRLESDGRSECPYLDDGKYDPFAQRKADSKAERNAQRKQIPELVIKEFLKAVSETDTQKVKVEKSDDYCTCTPNDRKKNPTSSNCIKCKKEISPIVLQGLALKK